MHVRVAARSTHHTLAIWVMILLVGAMGCGRKGDPQPPFLRVAEKTQDLDAHQEGTEAILRWSYPSMTTGGGPLPDVEAIEIWRTTLPPALEPEGNSSRDRQIRQQLIVSHGELIVALDAAGLADATRGPMLEYRDDLAAWYDSNKDQMPLVVWYTVRTLCCGSKRSAFSNIARILPEAPPRPPEQLTLSASADGITVSWDEVPGAASLIERSANQLNWVRITPSPVEGTEYLDSSAQQQQSWFYRVRSVHLTAGGGAVVGEPSESMEVDYPDVYPPPTPGNLVCLPEADLVRLRWEGVSEAIGYRIFRQREGGNWQQLILQPERTFEDTKPPVGNLTYAVKAVDRAGNDSETTTCTTVVGHP